MKRTSWEFPYTADKLLDAARAKNAHHTSRLEWWEGKKAETLTKIRAEGISVDESLAAAIGASNSYGRGPAVSVDDTLLRDLNECLVKVNEHRGKSADYAAWSEVLASQGQSSFSLNQDDWLFFFSKA